jgi:hypothetical protein
MKKEFWTSKQNALDFSLHDKTAFKTLDFLIEASEQGLTPSGLKKKMGHSALGVSSNLLKILKVAELAIKGKKEGKSQPYFITDKGKYVYEILMRHKQEIADLKK